MSSYIDLYKEAKSLLKKLQKKNCFQKFTTKDFFYFMDEKSRGILVFSEHLYKDGFGIQLFLNDDGLNYLHDILSTSEDMPINYFYSNCFLLGFIPKKDLLDDDFKFLRKNHIKLSQDYNLIPIKFKEGYGKSLMTKSDLNIAINYLYYIYALVCNDKEAVDMALENELTPLAIFNNEEMTYSVQYIGLPKLEQMPKYKPVRKDIVDDLKDNVFIDDTCYFYHTYFPAKVTNNDSYKTMVVTYYPKLDKFNYVLLDAEPSKIDQYFMGYIDELFNEFGKPVNVLFNHRKLYSIAYKTLNKLNIDVKYNRENGELDHKVLDLLVESAKAELDIATDDVEDDYEVEEDFEIDEESDLFIA